MAKIEPDGVRRLQPADRGTQIGAWSLYQQMIVVGHQAVRVDYHPEPIMGFRDGFQKPLPILIIAVDRLPLVASRRHVIDGIREFHSNRSGHTERILSAPQSVTCKELTPCPEIVLPEMFALSRKQTNRLANHRGSKDGDAWY